MNLLSPNNSKSIQNNVIYFNKNQRELKSTNFLSFQSIFSKQFSLQYGILGYPIKWMYIVHIK